MYNYEDKLIFNTAKLIDSKTDSDYDITVICLWLPNCKDTPLIMVDYYFDEPNEAATKKYADKWLATKTTEEINTLSELQGMIER